MKQVWRLTLITLLLLPIHALGEELVIEISDTVKVYSGNIGSSSVIDVLFAGDKVLVISQEQGQMTIRKRHWPEGLTGQITSQPLPPSPTEKARMLMGRQSQVELGLSVSSLYTYQKAHSMTLSSSSIQLEEMSGYGPSYDVYVTIRLSPLWRLKTYAAYKENRQRGRALIQNSTSESNDELGLKIKGHSLGFQAQRSLLNSRSWLALQVEVNQTQSSHYDFAELGDLPDQKEKKLFYVAGAAIGHDSQLSKNWSLPISLSAGLVLNSSPARWMSQLHVGLQYGF